ncbi:MAG TPA: hypothetical protein ENJ41_00680 [Oceanospirillales bacterium]|nr:hypothetical protein [Oceanospirillales bacterium]
MSTEKKNKTLYYKKATFLQDGGDLQKSLANALKSRKNLGARKETLNEEDKTYRLVGKSTKQGGMLFGNLVLYTAGVHQNMIAFKEDEEELNFEDIPPPQKKDGRHREFLDSVLYFGVLGNHVVVAQSSALRSRELENHWMWLLSDCTKVLNGDDRVMLIDQSTKATRKTLQKAHVKSVILGSELETIPEQDSTETTTLKTKKLRYTPVGKARDLLQAIVGEDFFSRNKLEDSLDDANLHVTLEISYLRKTTENAQKLLDNLAVSMRHTDKDDVAIKLEGGGTIKGDDLNINGPIRVNSHNGIIEEQDLYTQMFNWLEAKLQQGLIDA